MTTATTRDWRAQAACARQDTNQWFSEGTPPAAALATCRRCPVRAECLYDALTNEVPSARHGVWGGLTKSQRHALPDLPTPRADALGLLRTLLAHSDIADQPRAERSAPPMTATAPATTTELVTTSTLLRWAEDHPDPDVQAQGARTEASLVGLRQRYVADQELTRITTKRAQLEKELSELQAREAELSPPKKKPGRRSSPSYDAKAVRAWAKEAGVDCPAVGRVPKAVLAAWRTATEQTGADDS